MLMGRTPRSAADAPVGLSALCRMPIPSFWSGTRTPHPLSTSFLSSFLNQEGSLFGMGTLSPYPWDLPLSGQQYDWWDSRNCPTLSALESALGSHPCVALSSAQAFPA